MIETRATTNTNTRVIAVVFIALGVAVLAGLSYGGIVMLQPAAECSAENPGITATAVSWQKLTVERATIVADGNVTKGEQGRLITVECQREGIAPVLAVSDPDVLAASPLSESDRAAVTQALGSPVDVSETATGILKVLAMDDFQNKTEQTTITLVTSDDERLLAWPSSVTKPEPGSSIQVTGLTIGEVVVVQSFVDQPNAAVGQNVQQATTNSVQLTGTHRVLVAMVYFAGQEAPADLTYDDVVSKFFSTTSPSVKDYFSEMSRDQFELTGDVVGWYPSADPNPTGSTSGAAMNGIISSALQAVRVNNPAIDFRTYEYFVVVAPYTNDNLSDGMAAVGKLSMWTPDGYVTAGQNIIRSYNRGFPGYDVEPANTYIAAHEFGHQLGLWHAALSYCTSVPFATDCRVWEYGDYYDLMNGRWELQSAIGLNSPHRDYFGWLNPDEIQTITATGDYELVPLEVTTPGVKALKVLRANGRWMYIEYRQPIGYDAILNNQQNTFSPTTGLEFYDVPNSNTQTYLLDPAMNTLGYSPLDVGQQVTDPLTGTVFSVNSRTADRIVVHVNYRSPVVYPTMFLQTPAANSSYSGTIPFSATATHPSGIAQVEFWRSDLATPLAVDTTAPYSFNYDVSSIAAGTTIRVYMLAVASDGTRASTAPWSVSVLSASSSDTPPTVTIVSPTSGQYVSSLVTLSANINDDQGVSTSKFYIDCPAGYALASCASTYVGYPYSLIRSLASGAHTLTVVGYDYTGHTTQAGPISFIVDSAAPSVDSVNLTTASNSIIITAAARDDYLIDRLEFYQDGNLLGTDASAPYSWTVTTDNLSVGGHNFSVLAIDKSGKSSSLLATSYTRVTPPSTVTSVTSPVGINVKVKSSATSTTLRGTTTVSVTPTTASVRLKEVQVKISGSSTTLKDTKAPFSIAFDSSTHRNGAKTITIIGIDTAGKRYQQIKKVTVSNALSVRWPLASNAVLRRTVMLSPTIRGGSTLTSVEYRLDGRLIGKKNKSPYSLSWKTTNIRTGRHKLSVTVTTSEKKRITASVNIQVKR